MNETELCSRCKKPKIAESSGIVTQLVEACRCDIIMEEQRQTIPTCALCGMRVPNRSGTLTQWIFGKGLCECEKPELVDKPIESFISPSYEGFKGIEEEEELELDSDKFPIERYKPLLELGKGASGKVYLARDRLLGKKVAVKVLHVLEKELLVAFQDEAKATAKLDHPNIVKVLDFGVSKSNAPYMVMSYIPGISLEKLLSQKGVLDTNTAKSITKKIAEALSYAHSNDVLHRDIKPSNIMVYEGDESIEVTLIDFGIAKVKEATGRTTTYQDRSLAGTPQYMSPDTILGHEYDSRSEVYSLGCVVFETVVGRPPFEGESALETISMHAFQDVPKPNEILEEKIDPNFEAFLLSCLKRDRDSRFQSMQEILDDLNKTELEKTAHRFIQSAPQKYRFSKIGILLASVVLIAVPFLYFAMNQPKKRIKTKQSINPEKVNVKDSIGAAKSYFDTIDSVDKTLKKDGKKEPFQKDAKIELLQRKAELGNANAQFQLGWHYHEGVGGKPKEAVKWYQKAAQQGHLNAQYNLGYMFNQGIYVPQDYQKAFKYFSKVAKQGNAEGQLSLADLYYYGHGTSKNPKKAFELYKKAASKGVMRAQCELGCCYAFGIGTNKNQKKAIHWFLKPALKGYSLGQYKLGVEYLKRNQKGDQERAFRWFLRASNAGYPPAHNSLANCYLTGTGVEKNEKRGFLLLETYASQFPRAVLYRKQRTSLSSLESIESSAYKDSYSKLLYSLAVCYEDGLGTEKNMEIAKKYYRFAAFEGSSKAKDKLKELGETNPNPDKHANE